MSNWYSAVKMQLFFESPKYGDDELLAVPGKLVTGWTKRGANDVGAASPASFDCCLRFQAQKLGP